MAGYNLNTEQGGTPQAMTTSAKTLIRVLEPASGMRRCRFWEIEMSALGAPNASDGQIVGDFLWCDATTAGTQTGTPTPEPQDHGTLIGTAIDVAVTTSKTNFSAEPTVYAVANSWWYRGFNQRSGVLWQSQPGREIITPAVASIGPGLRALANTYTNTVGARLCYDEL